MLLAQVDIPVMWRPGLAVELPFGGDQASQSRYLRIVRAMLPGRQRRQGNSLGAILCAHLPEATLERVIFLKLLAKRIEGRIVAVSDHHAHRTRGLTWARDTLQQWLLSNLGHSVLMEIAQHQSLHRNRASRTQRRC